MVEAPQIFLHLEAADHGADHVMGLREGQEFPVLG
jgi:hypothetical protein